MQNAESAPTSLPVSERMKLIIYWLIVLVPSLWAVWQVVVKSAVLFK